MKIPTGVKRLDELLKGGYPERCAALLFGPPFVGQDVLVRQFALTGLKKGVPVILVTTDAPASGIREELTAADASYAAFEKKGLVRYVDTFSRSIGAATNDDAVEFVDGLVNFNAVNLAINNAQREYIKDHPQHIVVFDSVSTLIAYTNAATAFRYLQVMLGKAKAAGATSVLTLSNGMHAEAEVQAIKHLADGVVELRSDNQKNLLHVEGFGITDQRGWVEYRLAQGTVEITGSFAAGRIR